MLLVVDPSLLAAQGKWPHPKKREIMGTAVHNNVNKLQLLEVFVRKQCALNVWWSSDLYKFEEQKQQENPPEIILSFGDRKIHNNFQGVILPFKMKWFIC